MSEERGIDWWDRELPAEEQRRIEEEAKRLDAEDRQRFERAEALLPAWFIRRMIDDQWSFAFLLVTGHTLHLQHIHEVRQAADGTIWLDVELADQVPYTARRLPPYERAGPHDIVAPTSRLTASVNAAHVVLAYETADT